MAKIVAEFSYTDAEMLALVREAIAKVLLGQSYTIGNRSVTRADLKDLQAAETHYQSQVDAASGGIASNVVRLNRR